MNTQWQGEREKGTERVKEKEGRRRLERLKQGKSMNKRKKNHHKWFLCPYLYTHTHTVISHTYSTQAF